MPSPFPGMDPYLENPFRWGGVHLRMLVAISTQLNRLMPTGYTTEIEQCITVSEGSEDEESIARRNPDVFAYEIEPSYGARRRIGATALMEAPTSVTTLEAGDVRKHRRVLIQSIDGKTILTAIELLSPSNKSRGKSGRAYLAKPGECLAAGTNLVEIDLLRDGVRPPLGTPRPPISDYYILVSEAERRPSADIWAFTLRQPIPIFPIPLKAGMQPVPLDLKRCLDLVYDEGGYSSKIDYSEPATPPLNQPDAEWAAALLAKPAKKKKKIGLSR
jgi:hypothetical protein